MPFDCLNFDDLFPSSAITMYVTNVWNFMKLILNIYVHYSVAMYVKLNQGVISYRRHMYCLNFNDFFRPQP